MSTTDLPEEGKLVICRYITHYKTGRRIYPKNARFFVFHAKGKDKQKLPSQQLDLPLDREGKQ